VDFQRKLWREKTEEALQLVAEAGVTVHRPDKAAFVAATEPMYAALTDERIIKLVQRIRAVP
jgi:TRAP-type C4-dicarboxylate transport system substrate-binding protein